MKVGLGASGRPAGPSTSPGRAPAASCRAWAGGRRGWLLYAYLQQGQSEEAKALLATIRESLAKGRQQDMRNQVYGAYIQATMAATFLVETEQWDEASKLLGHQETKGVPQTGPGGPYQAFAALAESPAVFARGLAAAVTGSGEAQEAVATLQE